MNQLRWSLAIAGVIPFAAATCCLLLGIYVLPLLGSTAEVLSSYSVVIAAFMAGSQWGMHFSQTGRWQYLLPISSNFAAIFTWLSHSVLAHPQVHFALCVSFCWILFIDYLLYRSGGLPIAYMKLRACITACVILLLLATGFGS